MDYHFSQNHKATLILSKTVINIDQYNTKIALNNQVILAAINPLYLVSLKALLIALYRLVKHRNMNEYTSAEFQHDLHSLLIPEDDRTNKFMVSNLADTTLHIFMKGYTKEMESLFDKEHFNNLYQCCDLSAIKQYYKISDEEMILDQDMRGSVYNQIALKKLKH